MKIEEFIKIVYRKIIRLELINTASSKHLLAMRVSMVPGTWKFVSLIREFRTFMRSRSNGRIRRCQERRSLRCKKGGTCLAPSTCSLDVVFFDEGMKINKFAQI